MFSARIINSLRTARISKHVLEIYLFNRRMPSIYHENCGKPGPKSNAYIPPPEERVFKSRSAPNSPSLGERKYLFARASPRLTRALIQVSDKMTAAKNPKSGKVGRSKSFHGKGTYVHELYRCFFVLYCVDQTGAQVQRSEGEVDISELVAKCATIVLKFYLNTMDNKQKQICN